MQAFSAGNVPIYWGDPTVVEDFNEKAFVNCCGMTLEQAVEKIEAIDNNDELYLAMLKETPLVNKKLLEDTTNKLSEWLYRIIDSDYDVARRRPVHGKMAAYEEAYTTRIRREEKLKSSLLLRSVYNFIKKLKR